nr:MAG TPA: hypothetical protein [Caudoviricetes sp.]
MTSTNGWCIILSDSRTTQPSSYRAFLADRTPTIHF